MTLPKRFVVMFAALLLPLGAARAETMPQLDFRNSLLTTQVVWGAVIFAGFYLLLSRWGLPQVGSILELRAGTIAADLDRARQSKAEADRAVAEQTEARQRAYAQSQAAIADATRQAKAEAARRSEEQDARLDAKLAESEAEIGRARSAAMSALRQVSTETAVAVLARLTNGQADEARVAETVGQILAERGLAA